MKITRAQLKRLIKEETEKISFRDNPTRKERRAARAFHSAPLELYRATQRLLPGLTVESFDDLASLQQLVADELKVTPDEVRQVLQMDEDGNLPYA